MIGSDADPRPVEKERRLRQKMPFWLALAFVFSWTVVLLNYTPAELVEKLGVANSYGVAFLVSVFGAFSSFTTFSTYPMVVMLAAGRINPFILGAVAGVGLAVGDIFFYFFGLAARGATTNQLQQRVRRALTWLKKRSDLFIQFFIFFYVGFTPFPNNVLTGMLALDKYPFKKVVLPLVLGDLILPIVAAYLSYKGVDLIIGDE